MKALDVAAYIINLCIDEGNPVSNLQLQKIMYFTNSFYLKNNGKQLITDEPFEAWQFGPVIDNVYHKYSIYGGNPIINKQNYDIKTEIMADLRNVIINLSNVSSWSLVNLSHSKDGAWDKTYQNGLGNHKIIDENLIYKEALGKQ